MPEVLGNFWSIFIFFEKSTEGELLQKCDRDDLLFDNLIKLFNNLIRLRFFNKNEVGVYAQPFDIILKVFGTIGRTII